MSREPQLFRINPDTKQTDSIQEVDFSQLGLQERRDIQEWVADNPGILGEELLIIGKEFSGFDRTNERLDLLAVDRDGKLVIIELKRDDTGADAHWQAIKYASYFHHATTDDIIRIRAEYSSESQEDALTTLLQHMGADDLNALNNDQRIILASHRFAPEVTSAALWLNQKNPTEDLITCVKLTPYRVEQTGSLYIQVSTIIPVPGTDDYVVGVGDGSRLEPTKSGNSLGANLRKAFARNRDDEVTHFMRKVGQVATRELPEDIRPDTTSRWAGRHSDDTRYYHFWYRRPPWSNWGTSYRVNLWPEEDANMWQGNVEFRHDRNDIESALNSVNLHHDQKLDQTGIEVRMGSDTLNGDFANRIAEMTRLFIEQITPIVDDMGNEGDVEAV